VSEIDWAALAPGDPDPEPQAIGEGCGGFVRHATNGLTFDCTRSPHEGDPQHVSCAWWGPMTPDDSVVVATWIDAPDGTVAEVEAITCEQYDEITARYTR